MKPFVKTAAVAGIAGVLALASLTPSEARNRGWAVAAGIGLAGAAIASAAAAHSYGYYGAPAYAYEPDYAYGPAYAYAPAPAYTYVEPGYSAYATSPGYYSGGYNSNTTSRWQERKLKGTDY